MSQHTTTAEPTTTHDALATGDPPQRARRGRRPLVVAGTAVAALLLWLVAGPLLGIELDVLKTPDATTPVPVTAGPVILSAVVAGLLGWALLATLERLSARGAIIWRWVAGVVALVSLAGPLTLAQSSGAAVVLTLLHAVVGGILLLALPGPRGAGSAR